MADCLRRSFEDCSRRNVAAHARQAFYADRGGNRWSYRWETKLYIYILSSLSHLKPERTHVTVVVCTFVRGKHVVTQPTRARTQAPRHSTAPHCISFSLLFPPSAGGRRHPAQGFCPAKGSTCRRCGRKNHWDIVCTETDQTAEKEGRHHGYQRSSRGAAKSSHVRGKATVSTIDECPDVDADSMVFETISMHMDSMGDAQNSARDQVFVNLALRDVTWNGRKTELRAKVNTGALGNVLPLRIHQKMFPDRVDKDGQPIRNFLEKSSVRLVSYGGTLINQIGVCTLTCTYQQTRRKTRFFVKHEPQSEQDVVGIRHTVAELGNT